MAAEHPLLVRLGFDHRPARDHAGLAALQRAWCLTQPFHNLDLLAAARSGAGPADRDEAVERCAAGLGGPCHVHAWAFLTLLRAIGFDACLCAGSIAHPGDHLLVRVAVEGEVYICDVGNGQPYLWPFPLARAFEQRHAGWIVQTVPDGDGLVISRRSPDQPAWRVVYRALPDERTWADFDRAIGRHHREPGFGPFLTGLRVVRVGPAGMITVRNDQVTTYRDDDSFTRRRLTDDELVTFIAGELALSALPVAAAITSWRAQTASRS